jgi:hypothetical protein
VCLLSLAQWFFGAPDLRFGAYLFWMTPAVLLTPTIANAMHDATARTLMLVAWLIVAAWSGGLTPRYNTIWEPNWWGRPPDVPAAATKRVQTGPGTEVLTPVTGDACGDAPLLCTPQPRKQTLRDPTSISRGFLPAPPR